MRVSGSYEEAFMRGITNLMSVIIIIMRLILLISWANLNGFGTFMGSSKWFINLDHNDIKALPYLIQINNQKPSYTNGDSIKFVHPNTNLI